MTEINNKIKFYWGLAPGGGGKLKTLFRKKRARFVQPIVKRIGVLSHVQNPCQKRSRKSLGPLTIFIGKKD